MQINNEVKAFAVMQYVA